MKWIIMMCPDNYLVDVVTECHVAYCESIFWTKVSPPMDFATARTQANMIIQFT